MSCNTTLRTNLIFSQKTYTSKSQVEEALEFRTMNMYDALWDILRQNTNLESFELRQKVEELEDIIIDKFKLEMLLNDWDKCHDSKGQALHNKAPWRQEPELWGDFIESLDRE